MNRESHHWSTVRAEWILLHGGETCSTNPCSSVGFRVSFYGVDSLHSRWRFSTRSAWTGLFHLFSRSDALAERESQAALGHFLRGAWSLLQVWSISQLALGLTLLCVQEGAGGVEGRVELRGGLRPLGADGGCSCFYSSLEIGVKPSSLLPLNPCSCE